jgi:predicted ester cyclase
MERPGYPKEAGSEFGSFGKQAVASGEPAPVSLPARGEARGGLVKAKEKMIRTLLKRLRLDIWQGANLEAISDLFDSDCVVHVDNDTVRGVRALKDFSTLAVQAFPDLEYVFDDTEIADDAASVAVRWHGEGTHLGAFRGIAPTGRPVSFWGISMHRLRAGKISESWTVSTLPQAAEVLREAGSEPF